MGGRGPSGGGRARLWDRMAVASAPNSAENSRPWRARTAFGSPGASNGPARWRARWKARRRARANGSAISACKRASASSRPRAGICAGLGTNRLDLRQAGDLTVAPVQGDDGSGQRIGQAAATRAARDPSGFPLEPGGAGCASDVPSGRSAHVASAPTLSRSSARVVRPHEIGSGADGIGSTRPALASAPAASFRFQLHRVLPTGPRPAHGRAFWLPAPSAPSAAHFHG